jgi:DNA-binding CsgD family transcriptional regulator/LysM repeat protein
VRLRRYVYAPMLLLALWAVVLAVSPAVAEAQGIARAKDAQKGTERIVVSPGASLWSISEERLGPNATPQQIANATERIYALNRSQIGADPNLIFPGQKLLVPPVVGNPSIAEPSTGTTAARGATEPAEDASPSARVANSGTTDRASRTPSGATESKGEKASNPVAEPVDLPEVAAAAPVPAVRSLDAKASPRSPVDSFAKTVRSAVSSAESAVVGAFPRGDYPGRKLLGLGTIVLTLIVCSLMAWKLPMRRNVGSSAAWGIPGGYPNYRAHPEALDRYAYASAAQVSPTGFVPKQSLDGSDDEVTMAENDLGRVGIVGAVRGRRERLRRRRPSKRTGRRQAPRPRRPSREGSATGAYSPKIYRALSRAALETRPRKSANGRAKGTLREGGAPSARALLGKPEIVGNGHKPLGLEVNEESRPYQGIHLLSARQREVLELAAEGLPNAQIARRLFVTESTVKQHLYKAYKTLGVRNRREAAKFLSSNDWAERRPVIAGGVRQ